MCEACASHDTGRWHENALCGVWLVSHAGAVFRPAELYTLPCLAAPLMTGWHSPKHAHCDACTAGIASTKCQQKQSWWYGVRLMGCSNTRARTSCFQSRPSTSSTPSSQVSAAHPTHTNLCSANPANIAGPAPTTCRTWSITMRTILMCCVSSLFEHCQISIELVCMALIRQHPVQLCFFGLAVPKHSRLSTAMMGKAWMLASSLFAQSPVAVISQEAGHQQMQKTAL